MPELARTRPEEAERLDQASVVHEPSKPRELRYRTSASMVCARKTCDEVVPADEIVWRSKKAADFFCSPLCRNRESMRKKQARLYRTSESHREAERGYKLQAKYGISSEDWDDLFDQQLGRCAICLTTLAEAKVCVDHDHETGEVRGLLCNRCNQGIGYFDDDPQALRRAAEYVEGGDS